MTWDLSPLTADSKRRKLAQQTEEMNMLLSAGQTTNRRYISLTYIVAESREEAELRDFTRASKSTQPLLNHSSYSCIGSSTCLR